jgi:Ca2+-binding RTX toxin-like protein
MPTYAAAAEPETMIEAIGLHKTLIDIFVRAADKIGGLLDPKGDAVAQVWDGQDFSPLANLLGDATYEGRWTPDHINAFLGLIFNESLKAWGDKGLQALKEGFDTDPFLHQLAVAGFSPEYFFKGDLSGTDFGAQRDQLFKALYVIGEVDAQTNFAPEVIGKNDISVMMTEGHVLDLGALFKDADGDDLTFAIKADAPGVTITTNADGTVSFSADYQSAGDHIIYLWANDGQAQSEMLTVHLNVQDSGPGVAITTMDFKTVFGAADDIDAALAVVAKSRGLDILHQGAFQNDQAHMVVAQNLTIRGADGLFGAFTMQEKIRVLTLAGAADFDVTGNASGNLVYGNAGDNEISGLGGTDLIYGGAGADNLSGGEGLDRLIGGAGADLLEGGDGADKLYGGNGDDILRGGAGRDQMTGGSGADQFDFAKGDGVLIVTDAALAQDHMLLSGFDTVHNYAELLDHAQIVQTGTVVRIYLEGEQIILSHTKLADLNADFFQFG